MVWVVDVLVMLEEATGRCPMVNPFERLRPPGFVIIGEKLLLEEPMGRAASLEPVEFSGLSISILEVG